MKRLSAPFALALAAPLGAQGQGAFTVVETGRSYARLQDAVLAVGNGTGTIRIAPGRYAECAVQEAGRIAFVAAEPGQAIFDGVACEGKAALVLRGRSAQVEGLVFQNIRVPDGNGAGIRIERGDLDVAETMFRDGQCGILSAADPRGTIRIEHSTFSGLGRHPDGNGAHSLYVGDYGALIVTASRFERGTGGHYVKSRAARIELLDSSFDDSQGRDTNYMIDLPNGATGRIAGNMFVQGTGKENYSILIAIAAEGAERSSAGLVIENNSAGLAPGFRWRTSFVGTWTNDALVLRNNDLAPGIAPLTRH